jgi:DNA polymerase-3 subunit epsilon
MFVIFDVETTGLFASQHHRVLELAAVRIDDSGEIKNEFVSLFNPERDIGPTSIHGLVSSDILDAPKFEDLAGDIAEFFDGAIAYAGHNVLFDVGFLKSEFNRFGVVVPELPLACTMRLAGGGRLSSCCENHGIDAPEEAHSALDDARATAGFFLELYRQGRVDMDFHPTAWPRIPKSGRQAVTRKEVRSRPQTNCYLQRLTELSRETFGDSSDAASLGYLGLLERVLEDRRIDPHEGDALIQTASRWGLSLQQVEHLNGEFLRRLGAVALFDGIVTEAERKDIHQVATLLGRSTDEVDKALNQAEIQMLSLTEMVPNVASDLEGLSVCFTGELWAVHNGNKIDRSIAHMLATRAGLKILTGVTKKLDILVVADPFTQSGKAKKAREYGTRIMAESVFWKSIGVDVD